MINQTCQVDMYSGLEPKEIRDNCNRHNYSDHQDAEIQVEISTTSRISLINSTPKKKDSSCCTHNISLFCENNNGT